MSQELPSSAECDGLVAECVSVIPMNMRPLQNLRLVLRLTIALPCDVPIHKP